MPDVDRKLRVFLCHASQDKPSVRELYDLLSEKAWIDPWLDEEKLYPGQNWDLEIEQAVEAAAVVIVCCSNSSISKEGYIQRELKFVLDIALEKPEGTIFIIPLRLDNCEIPRRLKTWQYADFFPATRREKAFNRLVLSLKARANALGIKTGDTQALEESSTSASVVWNSRPVVKVIQHPVKPYFIDSTGAVLYLPKKQEFVIGRTDEDNKVIPDMDLGKWDLRNTVSRKHAKMIFHNGVYYLQSPHESLNGTFVNEIKVGKEMQELKDGDVVRFGGVMFRFRFKPHDFR